MPRDGHVALWHPWQDKPGQRHTLSLWSDFSYLSSVDSIVNAIGGGQYYALCTDILCEEEIRQELIRDQRTKAFISRTGSVSALQVRHKNKSGFLIAGRSWNEGEEPTRETLAKIKRTFDLFGYEALTPSSLSEKVLRSTLPARTFISRPGVVLRKSFIDNSTGGRIDRKSLGKFFPIAYEYDINKAYLSCAMKGVPSPFHTPLHVGRSSIWQSMPVSWLDVTMTCHADGIQPIQIEDNGSMREPQRGEQFRKWLWSGEIQDCLDRGYSLDLQHAGWAWEYESKFLEIWADILWDKYQECSHDEEVKEIIKTMMVGLPGRFLRKPEKYELVHRDDLSEEEKKSESVLPLTANWLKGQSPMSKWFIRVEEDRDSAQITPVGSYIVAECRREIYKAAFQAVQCGATVLRIYIDSVTTSTEVCTLSVGKERGQYKKKEYRNVRIIHGQFVGYDESGKIRLKAPGYKYDSQGRKKLEEELLCQVPP